MLRSQVEHLLLAFGGTNEGVVPCLRTFLRSFLALAFLIRCGAAIAGLMARRRPLRWLASRWHFLVLLLLISGVVEAGGFDEEGGEEALHGRRLTTSTVSSTNALVAAISDGAITKVVVQAGTHNFTSALCVSRAVTIEAQVARSVVLNSKGQTRIFNIVLNGVAQLIGLNITGVFEAAASAPQQWQSTAATFAAADKLMCKSPQFSRCRGSGATTGSGTVKLYFTEGLNTTEDAIVTSALAAPASSLLSASLQLMLYDPQSVPVTMRVAPNFVSAHQYAVNNVLVRGASFVPADVLACSFDEKAQLSSQ